MKASHKAVELIHGGYGAPQDAAWRDYLAALRTEMLDEMVAVEDGERDTVAHQIQLIDQLLRDTKPQQQ